MMTLIVSVQPSFHFQRKLINWTDINRFQGEASVNIYLSIKLHADSYLGYLCCDSALQAQQPASLPEISSLDLFRESLQ